MTQQTTTPPVDIGKMNYVLRMGAEEYYKSFYGTENELKYKDWLMELPKFDTACSPTVTIAYIGIQANSFDENIMQLCVYCWDKAQQKGGLWTGDLSENYVPNTGDTYLSRVFKQLHRCGWKGADELDNLFSFAQEYLGKEIPCWVKEGESKKTGKKYYMVASLGEGSKTQKPLSFSQLSKMMKPAATSAAEAAASAFGQAPTATAQRGDDMFGKSPFDV